jgi:hypothetical protein
MVLGWLLVIIGLGALGFALVAGGREERAFVAAQAASALAEHGMVRFGGDIPVAILVDLAVLAVVVPLALRSSKVWPLFAASLCVATLMTEAAQLLVHASLQAYAITQGAWDLLADVIVAIGAWNVWRARRQAMLAPCPARTDFGA